MMDLAEIRKKARTRKGEGAQDAGAAVGKGGRPASSIQGAPPAETASAAQVEEAAVAPAGGDPLDALFNGPAELDLATEEIYLQGLAERERKQESEDARQCLAFSLGDEEYALDIGVIREIIKPREITDVPRVPDFILGIISLRGVIIPIFDLKQRLKLGAAEISPNSRIIVCHQGDRSAGLLVDRLNQVVRLPGQDIEPPPAVLSGLDREMVEGVGRYRGRMMILLDLSSVLTAELI